MVVLRLLASASARSVCDTEWNLSVAGLWLNISNPCGLLSTRIVLFCLSSTELSVWKCFWLFERDLPRDVLLFALSVRLLRSLFEISWLVLSEAFVVLVFRPVTWFGDTSTFPSRLAGRVYCC